jgi:hypothetical protein
MDAHTVPRVYLKNFASKRGLVVVDISRPVDDQIRDQAETDVNLVSTRPDHYAFLRSFGIDNVFEETFQKVESEMRPLMKRIKSNSPLGANELELLPWLAAVQEARSERSLTSMQSHFEQEFAAIALAVRAAGGDDDAVRASQDEWVKKNVYDGDAMQHPANLTRLTIRTSIEMGAPMFAAMNKCVLRSEAHYFITADHPVVWVDPRVFGRSDGNRFSTTAEVTYPLTKHHCLLMSYMPISATGVADARVVSIVNARTAAFALKEVYMMPAGVTMHDALIEDLRMKDRNPAALGIPLSVLYSDSSVMPVSVRTVAERVGVEQNVVDEANADVIADLQRRGLGDFSQQGAPRVTVEEARRIFPRPLVGTRG